MHISFTAILVASRIQMMYVWELREREIIYMEICRLIGVKRWFVSRIITFRFFCSCLVVVEFTEEKKKAIESFSRSGNYNLTYAAPRCIHEVLDLVIQMHYFHIPQATKVSRYVYNEWQEKFLILCTKLVSKKQTYFSTEINFIRANDLFPSQIQ